MSAYIASGAAAFAELHASLCSHELPHARRDLERLAGMLTVLVETLGLAIALGSQGDPVKASELAEGVTARLFEAASDHANLVNLVGRAS